LSWRSAGLVYLTEDRKGKGLLVVLIGTLISGNFITDTNIANVVTRSAFIAIIAVGATFVISSGGLDLSVGSMMAFVTGMMILTMNRMEPSIGANAILVGAAAGLIVGALCGLLNGLIVTVGKIEPFIATLGTMGIFRALITWMSDAARFRPTVGIPVPVIVTLAVVLIGAFILYRTKYGRRCTAAGSNADVARFSGVSVAKVRTIAFVIQGLCVAIAAVCYIPRLGAATPTTRRGNDVCGHKSHESLRGT
jgi:ribose transport system permease protein